MASCIHICIFLENIWICHKFSHLTLFSRYTRATSNLKGPAPCIFKFHFANCYHYIFTFWRVQLDVLPTAWLIGIRGPPYSISLLKLYYREKTNFLNCPLIGTPWLKICFFLQADHIIFYNLFIFRVILLFFKNEQVKVKQVNEQVKWTLNCKCTYLKRVILNLKKYMHNVKIYIN